MNDKGSAALRVCRRGTRQGWRARAAKLMDINLFLFKYSYTEYNYFGFDLNDCLLGGISTSAYNSWWGFSFCKDFHSDRNGMNVYFLQWSPLHDLNKTNFSKLHIICLKILGKLIKPTRVTKCHRRMTLRKKLFFGNEWKWYKKIESNFDVRRTNDKILSNIY